MPLILGANSVSGYTVKNSLRFNSGSSDNLTRTPASASNRKTWTFSTWIKRSNISNNQSFFTARTDGSNYFTIRFEPDDLHIFDLTGGAFAYQIKSSALYRDVSAWYHIVIAFDTTQATAANRVRTYVNGSEITAFATASYPSQNADGYVNNTVSHQIGMNGSSDYLDGYMSEINFIDGQALTPSSFGETDTDTGIWKPKAYTGSFGTNGFYLKFANSASLGTDSSGNGNNFTVNNLTSIDQTTDTPTNNFATMNPLRQPTGNPALLSEGNLRVASASTGYYGGRSTIGVSSGKWYFEANLYTYNFLTGMIGIQNAESYTPEMFNSSSGAFAGYSSTGWSYSAFDGNIVNNNSGSSYGNTYAAGDIISVALDLDNSKLYFAKNGTWQNSGVPTSGATGTGAVSITSGLTYLFAVDDGGNDRGCTWFVNFGNPHYSANGYTDGAGYGNFSYAVPSGYYALCTKNLANFG